MIYGGKIPEHWEIKQLDEVGEIVSGGTPSTKEEDNWGDEIIWITPSDLTGYLAKTIHKGKKSISKLGLSRSSARLMPKGSVLFSSRAPIGYVVIAGTELCTNQGFKSIIPNEKVTSDYLFHFLKYSKTHVQSIASGTTFKEISARAFSSLKMPVPPLKEQHLITEKIEELFSELDAGRLQLETAKEQLKTYRQTVLKLAFEGKLTKKNDKESEFPRNWKRLKVDDVGNIVTGNTPSKKRLEYYSKKYPFYKPTDLEAGYNVKYSADSLSELGIKVVRYLPENSILVTCIGTIGKTGIIRVAGASNQQINAIIPNSEFEPNYIYYQVISPTFQDLIKRNVSSTTLPILNKSKFMKLPIIYCPLNEQIEIVHAIESRLSVCDNLEKTINNCLQQTEVLKQSILKQAFEGKLVKSQIN